MYRGGGFGRQTSEQTDDSDECGPSRRPKVDFYMRTTWDGQKIDHDPIKLTIGRVNATETVVFVQAPYFEGLPAKGYEDTESASAHLYTDLGSRQTRWQIQKRWACLVIFTILVSSFDLVIIVYSAILLAGEQR